ncbi:MAG: EamA family transporter [Alphaproteobacteria bacterium]|nr:EamA family transporter [Alphaproteobacteria bacterium]
MELWIILSLLAPLCWAFSNIIDQFLVRDSFSTSPTAYIFFQGLFYTPLLVVVYLLRPEVLALDMHEIGLVLAASPLWVINAMLYVQALARDDASIAVPLYNMVTFFVIILAWIFLGETISTRDFFYGCIVVVGATLLMWDFKTNKMKIATFLFMMGACWTYATFATFTRAQTQQMHWLDFYFWYALGFNMVCVIGTLLMPKARTLFMEVWQQPSKKAFTLSFVQAALDFAALMMISAAYSAAKTAGHVSFYASIQPLYVVTIAGIAGIFMPHVFEPLRANRALFWKLGCIGIMLFGIYFLTVVT